MPRVKCASCDCTWQDNNGYCKYVGEIKLTDCYVVTKHDGRQHFQRCKMFQYDDSIEEMQKGIIDFFKGKIDGNND